MIDGVPHNVLFAGTRQIGSSNEQETLKLTPRAAENWPLQAQSGVTGKIVVCYIDNKMRQVRYMNMSRS